MSDGTQPSEELQQALLDWQLKQLIADARRQPSPLAFINAARAIAQQPALDHPAGWQPSEEQMLDIADALPLGEALPGFLAAVEELKREAARPLPDTVRHSFRELFPAYVKQCYKGTMTQLARDSEVANIPMLMRGLVRNPRTDTVRRLTSALGFATPESFIEAARATLPPSLPDRD